MASVVPTLEAGTAAQASMAPLHFGKSAFRLALNEDAMATEKLAEGIRQFVADAIVLERLVDELKAVR